jgi:hypothetical protein
VNDFPTADLVLPLLVIDEYGPRVRELETAQIGDHDEHRRLCRMNGDQISRCSFALGSDRA